MRVKRSVLRRTVDCAPLKVKASSEDEIVALSFGLISIFLRHSPDSQLLQGETFERLRDFLNDLDLGVFFFQEQANGALVPVATATANRRLDMPTPSSLGSSQHVDKDPGCLLKATSKR